MFRALTFAAFFCLPLLGCIAPMGDRVLAVRANVVSKSDVPLKLCSLSLYSESDDRVIDGKTAIRNEFGNSFINPPVSGRYYFKIVCDGYTQYFKSPVYDFAKPPYIHDLGKVVIEQ